MAPAINFDPPSPEALPLRLGPGAQLIRMLLSSEFEEVYDLCGLDSLDGLQNTSITDDDLAAGFDVDRARQDSQKGTHERS